MANVYLRIRIAMMLQPIYRSDRAYHERCLHLVVECVKINFFSFCSMLYVFHTVLTSLNVVVAY